MIARRKPLRRVRLKRGIPLRRGRRRLGQRAAERRRAGGPRVVGRSALSVAGWTAVKYRVWLRAEGRCEVVLEGLRCPQEANDPEHVLACSAGGEDDPNNTLAVCRPHHRQTEAAFCRGRLVVTPLGQGRFACRVVVKADKWTPEPAA